MKVMKNHDTLNGTFNGTLKNDNLTNNELTLLGILSLILTLDKLNLLPWGNKVWRSEKTDFEGCLRSFKVDGMTWHYCSLR